MKYQSFDDGFEVRGVFLDISKAFDKVWHNGLIYKLKQNGVAGDLLDTFTSLLNERKQRVILNGQHSTWTKCLIRNSSRFNSLTATFPNIHK